MIVSTLAETLPGRNCPAGETSWRNAYHCCTSCRIWPEKLCLMFSTMLNLADLHLLSKKFHTINDCRYNYASLIFLWDVVWILGSVVGKISAKKSWFRWMEGHCWVSLLVNHLPRSTSVRNLWQWPRILELIIASMPARTGGHFVFIRKKGCIFLRRLIEFKGSYYCILFAVQGGTEVVYDISIDIYIYIFIQHGAGVLPLTEA